MAKTYPVPCTKEEIDNLIEAASDNPFYYVLFMVAKTTGRRLGEYYNVRVRDIDTTKNIMQTLILKRRQQVFKEALLRPDISLMLKHYIMSKNLKIDDYIFRDVSYRQIQQAVTTYAKRAKIDHKVSFHNFRHYFITELVKKGWSYDQIAKLTGHSTPGTIVSYDHAVASDIKDKAMNDIANM